MSWKKVCIKDVALGIFDGPHATPPESDSGAIFLGIPNFVNGQLDLTEIRYISEDDLPKWTKRVTPQENDIVFSYEATLNLYAIIPKDFRGCLGRRMALIRPDTTKINYKFLYYYFYSKAWRDVISENIVLGATVDRIPLVKFPDFQIELPDMRVQNKIADILYTYDSLIKNNQKQIKLLEEAAQRLYKEWFVDLRFPGHENAHIIEGIPQGWKRSSVGDIGCRIESGSRPKGGIDSALTDGVPSIGAENVIGLGKYNFSSDKYVSSEFYASMNRGKLKDRDILIYKDGAYIGRTSLFQDGFPHKIASVNEHVFLLHADNEFLQYYLFFTLYQNEYYLKMQKLNKNAAQPGINSKAMLSLEVLLPPLDLVEKFDELVTPIMTNIFAKAKQNRKLTEARDHLLPKLMSGELEV